MLRFNSPRNQMGLEMKLKQLVSTFPSGKYFKFAKQCVDVSEVTRRGK